MDTASLYRKIDTLNPIYFNELDKFIDSLASRINSHQNTLREREFGCLKGVVTISEDFDEPLEDFKDYM